MKGRASAKTKRCGFKKGEGEEGGEGKGKKAKKKKREKKERGREREKRKKNRLSCTRRLLGSFHSPHVEAGHRATNAQKRDRERVRVRERKRERERRRKVPQPASVSFHGDTEQWVRPISTIPPSRGRREIESREGGIF